MLVSMRLRIPFIFLCALLVHRRRRRARANGAGRREVAGEPWTAESAGTADEDESRRDVASSDRHCAHRGERAQELGLPAIAVPIYRELINVGAPDREGVTLALTTALLDAGDAEEAQKILGPCPNRMAPRGGCGRGWPRCNCASGLKPRRVGMRSNRERSARRIARGIIFSRVRFTTRAGSGHEQGERVLFESESAATTDLSKARFQMAGEQVRLRDVGVPTPELLNSRGRTTNHSRGNRLGYGFAENYAVGLSMLNRGGEAVEFLQRRVVADDATE